MDYSWEILKGDALEKANRILGFTVEKEKFGIGVEQAKKFGRKTVFLHDAFGVIRLYAIGGDKIWSYKHYVGWDDLDKNCQALSEWASNADTMSPDELGELRVKQRQFALIYFNGVPNKWGLTE